MCQNNINYHDLHKLHTHNANFHIAHNVYIIMCPSNLMYILFYYITKLLMHA